MGFRLTRPIAPCSSGFSIGGVKELYFARFANAGRYLYANDELGVVEWITAPNGNPTPFYGFEVDNAYVRANEELLRDNRGKTFPMSVSARFAKMTYEKRDILESMMNDRLISVVLDVNGKYWLMGMGFGLKVTKYNAGTDVQNGANGYTIELEGRERQQMKEVNATNFIYTSPNTGPLGQLTNRNLGGSLPDGGVSDVLSTWGQYESGVMVRPMPLSQLGNMPLSELL